MLQLQIDRAMRVHRLYPRGAGLASLGDHAVFKRSSLLFAGLSLLPFTAQAEDGKLDASLEFRARVEAIDGQFRPNVVPSDAALLLRTLIAVDYDAGKLRIGGEVQDSRVYFERRRSSAGTGEINALEPLQAYVATDFEGPINAKAGRFVLNLGSRRLVSRNNFRNTINGYTGVMLFAGKPDTGATAFWTVTQTRLPGDLDGLRDNRIELDRERGSPHFFGLFAHAQARALGQVEAYVYRLAENDSPDILTANRHLWTIGARIVRAQAKGEWDYEAEGVGQFGRTRTSTAASNVTDLPVRAGFLHLALGRTFAAAWQPRVAISADVASGDGPGRHYGRFDTLFGSRVYEYGPTSLYGAVQRANLLSVDARVEVRPDKRTDGFLAVRPLWLATSTDTFSATGVRDPAGRSGRYAGTQIETRVRRWLRPDHLRLSVGLATLIKGRFLDTAPNAPRTGNTHYGFAELTLTL